MEYFTLYNQDRIPLGKQILRGERIPDGEYHLVIHVCVFNSENKMLIQQRQPFKEGWSNMWDVSVGGSATAGENSQTAAQRELEEEIGLKVSFEKIRPILTVHFDHGFDDIYTLNMDVDINDLKLQYEEVQAVKWASEDEILEMIANGTFIPYHEHLISLLFFMRDHRGTFKHDEEK